MVEEWLEEGRLAVEELEKDGLAADLSERQKIGLETVLGFYARPALFIEGGRFSEPPDRWRGLERSRKAIEANFESVGRIEVERNGREKMIGTGFVVGEGLVMTNGHVVRLIADEVSGGWRIRPGHKVKIDFREERGRESPDEEVIDRILMVFPKGSPDLALLGLAAVGRSRKPLLLASQTPDPDSNREVYVVGYPHSAKPEESVPEAVLNEIFGHDLEVKRMQPGEILKIFDNRPVFHHDCSTLLGNSGSCVLYPEYNQVIGLHYGGAYRRGNAAVALWRLAGDSRLAGFDLNFD